MRRKYGESVNFLRSALRGGARRYIIDGEVIRVNLLYRIRNAAARFMFGRAGFDQLCLAMLLLAMAARGAARYVRAAAPGTGLRVLSAVLLALLVYRALSRDLAKRRAENVRFLYIWNEVRSGFRAARERRADKAHKYVKCACGAWCRVPRNVGRVELMCPRCGEKTIVNT